MGVEALFKCNVREILVVDSLRGPGTCGFSQDAVYWEGRGLDFHGLYKKNGVVIR